MSRRIALAALLALLVLPAHARERANPTGRLVRPSEDGAAARARSADLEGANAPAAASALASPAPLASGAVVVDSTWYDLQDMGSLGTRIVAGADGRVHVTYVKDFCELEGGCPPNLGAAQPYPQRAMGYAVRIADSWVHRGKVEDPDLWNCCLTEKFGAFGTIAVTPDGRAAISQHMNEEGCDLRGVFYLQDAVNGASYSGQLTPIVSPSYLFPQIAAVSDLAFTVMGEVPKGGEYDEVNEFRVSHLAQAGAPFVCPIGWQMGAWTSVAPPSLFRDGKPAFPSLATARDGRAGIAVGDFGGNVFLIESTDGSFGAATLRTRQLTGYVDAAVTAGDSTSNQFRPFLHVHLAYNDTTPNVVWSELQARRSGGSVVYFDHGSRILHWSPDRGVSVVKQVGPGEADRYDDVDLGLTGPLCGFNTLSVDWPQVGFSADGSETYVAWLRYHDDEIDPTADIGLPGIVSGIGYGDIALSATRGAEPWSVPQNLTNTPTTDERFFSLAARNPGGRAHLVYQSPATDQAGVALIGDRGTTPGNLLRRIAYLEAPIAASVVGIGDSPRGAPAIRAHPNPARGALRFTVERDGDPETSLEVIDVQGRTVARLSPGFDGTFRWAGRDAGGLRVPAGVYFARIAGEPSSPVVRFTFLN